MVLENLMVYHQMIRDQFKVEYLDEHALELYHQKLDIYKILNGTKQAAQAYERFTLLMLNCHLA